jgi:protein-S-isoprenylcysteine O-methyltransferase Ste14
MEAVAELALACYSAYGLVAFGLRAFLQWRRTGSSGLKGVRPGAGPLEWLAGVGLVAGIALGVVGAVLALNESVDPLPPLDGHGGHAVGLALFVIGFAGTFYSQLAMGASWRVGVDAGERTELITAGPFRLVRNPIYAAMLPAFLGLALLTPNAVAVAGFVLVLASLELQVRVVEEPHLLRVHGDDYRRYAERVGRFVPGVGRL